MLEEMAVTLLMTRMRSETFWEEMVVALLMTRARSETFWEVMTVTLPVIRNPGCKDLEHIERIKE